MESIGAGRLVDSLLTMKGAEMASAITSRVQTTTWCIVLSLLMIAAGMLS